MTTVHAQTGIKLATKPAKTSLLGGHFIYKADGTTETPPSANVVEWVDNDPTLWRHNVHIGSNGIKLRYGETTLSKWDTNSLIFYIPTTINGITTTAKAIELNSTNGIVLYKDGTNKGLQLSSTGLEIFGSSQSTADVTINSSGINIGNGKITGGTVGTTTQYEPDDNFIYLSTHEYGSTLRVGTFFKTNWQLVVGKNFGVTSSGDVYAYNATMTGRIIADRGKIGGTLDDNNGWSILAGRLYTGTIGAANSLHMRTSDLDDAVSINNCLARTDWRLTVGNKFGVTKDGELFADGANLTNINVGTITISDISGLQNSLTYAQNNADYYFDDITNGVAVHNYTNTTQPDNRIEITSTNGLEIFKGGVSVAQYSTTARIGQIADGKSRVEIKETGIKFYNRTSGTDVTLAHIGYGQGIADGGSTTQQSYPYYTLGLRNSDSSSTRGNWSFAEGTYTTAKGYSSHAEGRETEANGSCSHAEGDSTVAKGLASHTEGIATTANGDYSHAEGCGTTAGTSTSGEYSHAEGYTTEARNHSSHAEGYRTIAKGRFSHAEGADTLAEGLASHAEGDNTQAIGDGSHTSGVKTKAGYDNQTAIGKYNNNISTNAFEIGNGSNGSRSNAFAVDWNGNITVANHSSHIGDVKSHAPSDVSCSDKKYYQLAYLTLDPGVWIIDACGRFPDTNTTGMRQIRVSTATSNYNNVSDAPQAVGNIAVDARPAVKAYLYPNVHFPVKVTSTTTYRVIGYQSSGSAVSVSGRIYATRIQ